MLLPVLQFVQPVGSLGHPREGSLSTRLATGRERIGGCTPIGGWALAACRKRLKQVAQSQRPDEYRAFQNSTPEFHDLRASWGGVILGIGNGRRRGPWPILCDRSLRSDTVRHKTELGTSSVPVSRVTVGGSPLDLCRPGGKLPPGRIEARRITTGMALGVVKRASKRASAAAILFSSTDCRESAHRDSRPLDLSCGEEQESSTRGGSQQQYPTLIDASYTSGVNYTIFVVEINRYYLGIEIGDQGKRRVDRGTRAWGESG